MTNSPRRKRIGVWGAALAVTLSAVTVAAPNPASAAAPGAPGGLSPSSASTPQKDVELHWTAVSGATSYDVQIMDDDNPDLARVQAGTSSINRWTVPVQLPTGEYRWRVRARNSSGVGSWSAMATLVRGWDDQVSGLTHLDQQVPTLSWNPIPDASFYEVEMNLKSFDSSTYSRANSFVCWTAQTTLTPYGVSLGTGTFDTAPGNMTSCALGAGTAGVADATSSLIYGRTYFWRVRGRDGTVDATKTTFPDASAACLGPWLSSDVTVDADGVVTVPVGETVPSAEGAPECSDWSTQSTFLPTSTGITVGAATAPTALAVAPLVAGSSSRVSADPTFSWAPVPHAIFYRLYVSRDPQIGSLDFAATTQGTSLTPVTGLRLTSTTQYWAVQACSLQNADPTDPTDPATVKDCGPISPAKAISQVTANPAAPQSFAAADGHLLATWTTGSTARAAAKAYQVELTRTESGAKTITTTDRLAASVSSGTSSLAIRTAGLAEGTYTYRVRPVLENDRSPAWSATSGSAVVDLAAPTVRLSSAAGVVNRTPVRLTFSEPVNYVSASTVGVATSTNAKVAGTLTAVNATTWTFTPSSAWTTGGYLKPWTSGVSDRAAKAATAVGSLVRAGTTAESSGSAIRWITGDAGWTTRTSSDASGGSYRSTTDRSTTAARSAASTKVFGSGVTVRYCKSPTSGSMRVYVDGKLRSTVSQYQSYTSCGRTVSVTGLAKGQHVLTLQAVANGTRGTVSVDRISVS